MRDNIFYARNEYGGVAQLARAFGSYPGGLQFESERRYQHKKHSHMRVFFLFEYHLHLITKNNTSRYSYTNKDARFAGFLKY